MEEKITKQDVIIAEFMGESKQPYEFPKFGRIDTNGDWKDIFFDNQLKFHSDWNWLMEVVEKIRSIDSIAKEEFRTNLLHYQRNNKTIFDLSILEGKEYIYNACIEFIKWYNNQNSAKKTETKEKENLTTN